MSNTVAAALLGRVASNAMDQLLARHGVEGTRSLLSDEVRDQFQRAIRSGIQALVSDLARSDNTILSREHRDQFHQLIGSPEVATELSKLSTQDSKSSTQSPSASPLRRCSPRPSRKSGAGWRATPGRRFFEASLLHPGPRQNSASSFVPAMKQARSERFPIFLKRSRHWTETSPACFGTNMICKRQCATTPANWRSTAIGRAGHAGRANPGGCSDRCLPTSLRR